MQHITRNTYNQSANLLSKHYDEIGPREGDINLAFMLAGDPEEAEILEIGCGNGRDAGEIIKRTSRYTGIDIAEQMITIARQRIPGATFEVADAVTYNYIGPYDIVFAFASFRHFSLSELTIVLKKVYQSLRQGGILYISSNLGDAPMCESRNDIYGAREICYYNPAIIQKHAPHGFKKVQELYDTVNGEQWFEVAFQKK